MNRLPINEVFETIQGEAYWTGTPAIFIRLQGCAVGCPWCDTKHTWKVDPANEVSKETMLAKTGDGASYALLSVDEIEALALSYRARHIVITGGEPCDFDLSDLSELLVQNFVVQIETSGTSKIRVSEHAFVTVSPKIGMPGGRTVRADALERADEVKMPVGKARDVEQLKQLLLSHHASTDLIWLQPLSQSAAATKLCVEAATENGWRISLQTHKVLGVR